jgi:predicted ATPase
VYRCDGQKYLARQSGGKLLFFDRCAVESLGMVNEAQPLSVAALYDELYALNFHRIVFLPRTWEGIYCTDTERDHTFAHAMRDHDSLLG